MDEEFAHLNAAARDMVKVPADERIKWMARPPFVEHPWARSILDRIEGQLTGATRRNLLVWGHPGLGKTTIMRRHVLDHPPVFNKEKAVRHTPVVAIEMPPVCNLHWFYAELLRQIGAPVGHGTMRLPLLESRIVSLYLTLGVRQILVDEAHNILTGTGRQQQQMLTVIRRLTNTLNVPLVFLGIQDLREAIRSDGQLARRFEVVNLPSWQAGDDFNALVGSILRSLPLRKPSLLTNKALRVLLAKTEGVTANVFDVLIELAVAAIKSGEECVTAKALMDFARLPGLA